MRRRSPCVGRSRRPRRRPMDLERIGRDGPPDENTHPDSRSMPLGRNGGGGGTGTRGRWGGGDAGGDVDGPERAAGLGLDHPGRPVPVRGLAGGAGAGGGLPDAADEPLGGRGHLDARAARRGGRHGQRPQGRAARGPCPRPRRWARRPARSPAAFGLWAVITTALALFVACWLAGELGLIERRRAGDDAGGDQRPARRPDRPDDLGPLLHAADDARGRWRSPRPSAP